MIECQVIFLIKAQKNLAFGAFMANNQNILTKYFAKSAELLLLTIIAKNINMIH